MYGENLKLQQIYVIYFITGIIIFVMGGIIMYKLCISFVRRYLNPPMLLILT